MKKYLQPYIESIEERIDISESLQLSTRYYSFHKNTTVRDNVILYEAYFGRGMVCNPLAIFRYLLNNSDFKNYIHVWSLEKSPLNDAIRSLYRDDPRVIFVEPESDDYFRYQGEAKYLINNVTWKAYFSPKREQVLINTWHGIPLKRMGYESQSGKIKSSNMVRNFLMTKYLLSPSEYTTDLFKRAYRLENIFEGKYVEAGSPRVDLIFNSTKEELKALFDLAGIELQDGKKIALFAPTFRGDYSDPDINIEEIDHTISLMQDALGPDYQVLYKPHQVVYEHMRRQGVLKSYFIPAEIDINIILSQTDLLISDFSSVFFDFLVTNRPVVFFVPDYEDYENERGVYFSLDELPGPVCRNKSELSDSLKEICQGKSDCFNENYRRMKEILANDDGNATKKVVDAIWHGDDSCIVTEALAKPRIMFHMDIILKNGISYSAFNLLNLIDTDKYDITFIAIGEARESEEFVNKLPDEIRILYKPNGFVGDIEDLAKKEYCLEHAIVSDDDSDDYPDYLYEVDYHRRFGFIHYDFIINFSGFSAFRTNLLSVNKEAVHLIWMHNVMMSEYERVTSNKKVFEKKLKVVFKHYKNMDYLVSCSKATMLQNIKDLATEETRGKFRYVSNTMNGKRVIEGKNCEDQVEFNGRKYLIIENDEDRYSLVREPDSNVISFVTMGRITDAKNHFNLLKAFYKFHKTHPDACLYIIGDGPQKHRLFRYIKKYDLSDNVTITGNINNPFSLMSHCSCFILPSYYEGQPMVILEARTLGMPIIMSDFATAPDSSYENGQLIIGTSADEILKGMNMFAEGKVPNEHKFDPDAYNQHILDQLYSILDSAEKKNG